MSLSNRRELVTDQLKNERDRITYKSTPSAFEAAGTFATNGSTNTIIGSRTDVALRSTVVHVSPPLNAGIIGCARSRETEPPSGIAICT